MCAHTHECARAHDRPGNLRLRLPASCWDEEKELKNTDANTVLMNKTRESEGARLYNTV